VSKLIYPFFAQVNRECKNKYGTINILKNPPVAQLLLSYYIVSNANREELKQIRANILNSSVINAVAGDQDYERKKTDAMNPDYEATVTTLISLPGQVLRDIDNTIADQFPEMQEVVTSSNDQPPYFKDLRNGLEVLNKAGMIQDILESGVDPNVRIKDMIDLSKLK
jgi:hypothetical protein